MIKNSFKALATSIVASGLMVANSSATTVGFNNFLGNFADFAPVTDSGGTPLVNNSGFVALGHFGTLADAAIIASVDSIPNYTQLAAEFVQFGVSTPVGAGLADGLVSNSQSVPTPAGSPFIGQNIFTVVGNGTEIANSTELLVYKFDDTFAEDAPAADQSVTLLGAPTTPANLLVGTFGDPAAIAGVAGTFPAFATEITPIPEPSAVWLFSIATIGFLFRRKR